MNSPPVSAIVWRDLVACRPDEVARELCLPLPWLGLALWLGQAGHAVAAMLATFVLFMTGLRVTHNAFHRTLGLPAGANDAVMFVLSVLLGGSMHAIEVTHLHHHRHCLAPDDVEGRVAHLGFWRALLHSPAYPLLIHREALRRGSRRQRRWIVAELAMVALLQACIWQVFGNDTLKLMSLALLAANASAAMVGIWAVHRACDHAGFAARTSRSALLNTLTAGMFRHLEHHLYPAVPTRHLQTLARRFDVARCAPIRTVAGFELAPRCADGEHRRRIGSSGRAPAQARARCRT